MKRLIIPTDFSEGAWNAFVFALDMAQALKVEQLLILNAYYEPHAGAATMISLQQLMREESEKNMETLQTRIEKKKYHQIVDMVFKSIHLPLNKAINSQITHPEEDLVVMGTQGETAALEKLVGSNAFSVMKTCRSSVMIIPPEARFGLNGKIVLAVDQERLPSQNNFQWLKSLSQTHPLADIEVVQVLEPNQEPVTSDVDHLLDNIPHKHRFIYGENVATMLDEYIKQEPVDVLTLVRTSRNLWERLFHKSITKKLALHARVPMLILKPVES